MTTTWKSGTSLRTAQLAAEKAIHARAKDLGLQVYDVRLNGTHVAARCYDGTALTEDIVFVENAPNPADAA